MAVAMHHLARVFETRDSSCECLNGFLELTAKEALLRQDAGGIDASIQWGSEVCAEFRRTLDV
jgi:hypothetical protein